MGDKKRRMKRYLKIAYKRKFQRIKLAMQSQIKRGAHVQTNDSANNESIEHPEGQSVSPFMNLDPVYFNNPQIDESPRESSEQTVVEAEVHKQTLPSQWKNIPMVGVEYEYMRQDVTSQDPSSQEPVGEETVRQEESVLPPLLDETKMVIANVYDYFKQEYAELKKRYRRMDLTSLSKFSERTALATRVSESIVLEILQERARRIADVPQKPARKRPRQPERIETLVIKEEPPEANYDEPEIYAELINVKMTTGVSGAYMDQADPIGINLKIEPRNDATEQASVSSETQAVPRATTRYTAMSTQQHTGAPPASLFPPAPHTLHDEPEIYVQLPNVKMEPGVSGAYMEEADPIGINLKIEPRNDATEQASTSNETQGVPRATTRYTALSTQQHTGAPPASLFPPATHTLQVLQRRAGHLRVRSTHMHEDGLS